MWYPIIAVSGIVILWIAISVITHIRRNRTNWYEINYYRNWNRRNKKGGDKGI